MKLYGSLCDCSISKAGERGSSIYLALNRPSVTHQSTELLVAEQLINEVTCISWAGLNIAQKMLCQNLSTRHH